MSQALTSASELWITIKVVKNEWTHFMIEFGITLLLVLFL